MPTLLYQLAGRQVEDRLEPLPDKAGLRQRVSIRGGQGSFSFQLPAGDKAPRVKVIEPKGAGPVGQLNGKAGSIPVQVGKSGEARLVLEWMW